MGARILAAVLLAAFGAIACDDLELPTPAPPLSDDASSSTPSVVGELGESPMGSCRRDRDCPFLDCTCGRFDARIQKCTNGVCANSCAAVGCTNVVRILSPRP